MIEDILSKLNDIYNTITGVLVFNAFTTISLIFIFLIVFFCYYDYSKSIERKKLKEELRKEIEHDKKSD